MGDGSKYYNTHGAREKIRGPPTFLGFFLWRTWISVQNYMEKLGYFSQDQSGGPISRSINEPVSLNCTSAYLL